MTKPLAVILPLMLMGGLVTVGVFPRTSRADSKPDAGAERGVAIKGMSYSPDELKVNVGDTVTWTNHDDRDHTVVAKDGSFKSGNISRGESFSYKFKKAGAFPYGCKYHPRMKGTVVVAGE